MNLKYAFTIGILALALCVMPAVSEPTELYNGEVTLTDDLVTITTSQEETFEIPAATPLGILELLFTEEAIESYVASSKSFEKKGILLLDGINGMLYSGDTTWFVTVDGYQLEDFVNNETDGLNIYEIPVGAEVSYWYGLPILPIEEAEAVITVVTV